MRLRDRLWSCPVSRVLARNSKVLATTTDDSVVPVAFLIAASADVGDVRPPTKVPSNATRSITLDNWRTVPIHIASESPRRRRHAASVPAGLLDHLVRPLKHRRRDPKAEHLRRVHIDDQLELGRPLERIPEIPR